MTHFENPIVKKVTELQKGDVFRCEFGDFDNFITAVFESSEPYIIRYEEKLAIDFHYPEGYTSAGTLSMVADLDTTVEVIGKE
jgi:hypothetical protein